MSFQVNDIVTWTSQAGGHAKTKTGRVVAVVDAKRDPRYFIPVGYSNRDFGFWRNHETYLVAVGKKIYWPRVSALKLAS